MEYYVIADQATVLGFSLVGVDGWVAINKEDTEKAFDYVIKNSNIGIIIISISCANFIRDRLERYIFSEDFPLIVEIPDDKNPKSQNLRELVRKAVGVS